MKGSSAIQVTLLVFLLTIGQTKGKEYLSINHKPSYIVLDEKVESIQLSDIQHVISSMFGFTLHTDLKFDGLFASSPFQHPTGSIVLALYGGDDFVQQLKGPKLNLNVNDVYVSSNSLKHRLQHMYPDSSNVVEIDHETKVTDLEGILEGLSDSKHTVHALVTDLLPSSKLLNSTKPEIIQLLKQTALVLQSLTRVSMTDDSSWQIPGTADFYSFELHLPVSDSQVLNEEVNALISALVLKVNEVMRGMYGQDYVSLVLSLPESNIVQVRRARSLLAVEADEPKSDDQTLALNAGLSSEWTEDYPVIFHIVLWLFVFMALLVIFVTHGMMTMDPGNDSIIYRMTTTRMKKD